MRGQPLHSRSSICPSKAAGERFARLLATLQTTKRYIQYNSKQEVNGVACRSRTGKFRPRTRKMYQLNVRPKSHPTNRDNSTVCSTRIESPGFSRTSKRSSGNALDWLSTSMPVHAQIRITVLLLCAQRQELSERDSGQIVAGLAMLPPLDHASLCSETYVCQHPALLRSTDFPQRPRMATQGLDGRGSFQSYGGEVQAPPKILGELSWSGTLRGESDPLLEVHRARVLTDGVFDTAPQLRLVLVALPEVHLLIGHPAVEPHLLREAQREEGAFSARATSALSPGKAAE
eukprot:4566436-Amphidinium_carterae.1